MIYYFDFEYIFSIPSWLGSITAWRHIRFYIIVVYGVPSIRPDYARWLPILRNQLKGMDLSKIRHVLAFAVTNSLMH